METRSHSRLKRLAAAWLLQEGCQAVATEVRCPGSRYRVDAAGYLDRLPYPASTDAGGGATLWATVPKCVRPRRRPTCQPRTIVIECKQSRGDFIRDGRKVDELLALREEVRRWQAHLEEHRIKPHEPELRRSDTALFAELETWDFAATRLASYRRLVRRLRRIERQLYGETKFNLMARHRLADQLYIAAPRGLIRRREVPEGWGLLEAPRELLRAPTPDRTISNVPNDSPDRDGPARRLLTVTFEAPPREPKPDRRHRLLRNIAVAATRDTFRQND